MRKLLLGSCAAVIAAFSLASCFGDEFSSDCHNDLSCADGSGGTAGTGGSGGNAGSSTGANGGAANDCATECKGSTPVCDDGDCVECTAAKDSACDDPTPLCDPDERKCVECIDNDGCGDPTKPFCDNGTCTKCTDSTLHCSHITEKPVCDQEAGACVECTVEDESACGDKSCNPDTHECTDTVRESRKACDTCVADSECEEDYRCVQMQFNGDEREGGYCLKVATTGCSKPLTVPTDPRPSLSGADAEQYCGVNESLTTCEAVQALIDDLSCAADTTCGAPTLNDGLCKTVNFVPTRCSYRCGANGQCPEGFDCKGTAGSEYCGGP